MRGQAEQIAVVGLQGIRQSQSLPSLHNKRQNRFHVGFGLKFDINRPIVDVSIDQEVPLPPRALQVTRADQVDLMHLIAAGDMGSRIRTQADRGLWPKRLRGSASLLQDAFDSPQRRQRFVTQTSQLVMDRRRTCQPISFARTMPPRQLVANIQNRLPKLVRPAARIALRRMQTVSQSSRPFRLISVPPSVKPFSTSLQTLTNQTYRLTCLFQPDRLLSQYQFLRHSTSSRKIEWISQRIVSCISWRLSLSSVTNHLAVTCQQSSGSSQIIYKRLKFIQLGRDSHLHVFSILNTTGKYKKFALSFNS